MKLLLKVMNLIDTSVLVAFFRTREDHHLEAEQLLLSLDRIVVTEAVLLELLSVLTIREQKSTAQRAIKMLHMNERVQFLRLTDEELNAALRAFYGGSSSLSFVDESLLVLHKTRKARVYSFDRKLINALKR